VRHPDAVGSAPKGGILTVNGVARAGAAGILFPLSIVAGYLLGKWVGTTLAIGSWPAFVGAALGAVGGFWNLYRLLRGLESGGDPP